jgi:hypothetical protein
MMVTCRGRFLGVVAVAGSLGAARVPMGCGCCSVLEGLRWLLVGVGGAAAVTGRD